MNFLETLGTVHKSIGVWYAYLVSTSIVLQESWAEMDDFIPKRYRHAVLGIVTIIYLGDKIRRRMKSSDSAEPPRS